MTVAETTPNRRPDRQGCFGAVVLMPNRVIGLQSMHDAARAGSF